MEGGIKWAGEGEQDVGHMGTNTSTQPDSPGRVPGPVVGPSGVDDGRAISGDTSKSYDAMDNVPSGLGSAFVSPTDK